jgi:predicted enzyme related to lactoylglutathione lyase
MILGLRTAIYSVGDLSAAKDWYGQVLQRQPYFDEPFYVGFEVGGFELGLIPDGVPGPGGVEALWGVADIAAEMKRLEEMGVTVRDAVKEVGSGIKVATIADPWGNCFGLIENPHFSKDKVQ